MKFPPLRHLLLIACVSGLTGILPAADKETDKAKSPELTLEDVIFDAKYLKQVLGPKTLVAPAEKTTEIPTEAIRKAGLDEKTKIFALPDQAEKPVLKYSLPPTYPRSLRLSREGIRAKFLVFVGADGNVKSLYCYETSDQVFAIATADAVIKWRYTPAKIGQTAVPVLLPVEMDFSESAAATSAFRSPKNPFAQQGNPPEPKPVRPGADNAPR